LPTFPVSLVPSSFVAPCLRLSVILFIIENMPRKFAALLFVLLASTAWAGIVEDVRLSLSQKNFNSAESELNAYKAKLGVTPEYVEALSWMGRAALETEQYSQADSYAKQTLDSAAALLKGHSVDSDPHLSTAVGAALEVEALSLAGRGQKTQGIALLRRDRKSTRLNSSHVAISYAVFCLKKKNK